MKKILIINIILVLIVNIKSTPVQNSNIANLILGTEDGIDNINEKYRIERMVMNANNDNNNKRYENDNMIIDKAKIEHEKMMRDKTKQNMLNMDQCKLNQYKLEMKDMIDKNDNKYIQIKKNNMNHKTPIIYIQCPYNHIKTINNEKNHVYCGLKNNSTFKYKDVNNKNDITLTKSNLNGDIYYNLKSETNYSRDNSKDKLEKMDLNRINNTEFIDIYPILVNLEGIKQVILFDAYNYTYHYINVYIENWNDNLKGREDGYLIYKTSITGLSTLLKISMNKYGYQVMRFIVPVINNDGSVNVYKQNGKISTRKMNENVWVEVLIIPREYESEIKESYYSESIENIDKWNYNIELNRTYKLDKFKEYILKNLNNTEYNRTRLNLLQGAYWIYGNEIIEQENKIDNREYKSINASTSYKNNTKISGSYRTNNISLYLLTSILIIIFLNKLH